MKPNHRYALDLRFAVGLVAVRLRHRRVGTGELLELAPTSLALLWPEQYGRFPLWKHSNEADLRVSQYLPVRDAWLLVCLAIEHR